MICRKKILSSSCELVLGGDRPILYGATQRTTSISLRYTDDSSGVCPLDLNSSVFRKQLAETGAMESLKEKSPRVDRRAEVCYKVSGLMAAKTQKVPDERKKAPCPNRTRSRSFRRLIQPRDASEGKNGQPEASSAPGEG